MQIIYFSDSLGQGRRARLPSTKNGDTLARTALSLHRPDEWPEVLSVTQVSNLLSIGRSAVVAAIERGELSAIAIGGQYRIAAESVWRLVPAEIRARWPEGRWRQDEPDSAT